ncbi:hypothetical protein AC249_AIPGENE16768 [Exaiptasia diaphana]|nr:hypothetical protein AC249_AIPGENE16768 [Exaiptasia diaphana]
MENLDIHKARKERFRRHTKQQRKDEKKRRKSKIRQQKRAAKGKAAKSKYQNNKPTNLNRELKEGTSNYTRSALLVSLAKKREPSPSIKPQPAAKKTKLVTVTKESLQKKPLVPHIRRDDLSTTARGGEKYLDSCWDKCVESRKSREPIEFPAYVYLPNEEGNLKRTTKDNTDDTTRSETSNDITVDTHEDSEPQLDEPYLYIKIL